VYLTNRRLIMEYAAANLIPDGLELCGGEWEEVHEAVAVNDLTGLPVVAAPHTRLLQHLHITITLLKIRIRMFLDLLDPDPLVRGTNPDSDPSIIKQK
jgi:hypothetical protein